MRLLLDTHAALWLINDPKHLSSKTEALLLDKTHLLHLSIASIFLEKAIHERPAATAL
ncbi:MAG: hypothetical protein FWG02_00205 [Holophagaceae bacterium]|nr:hypothetical protein [Holophagaceae bacterium]